MRVKDIEVGKRYAEKGRLEDRRCLEVVECPVEREEFQYRGLSAFRQRREKVTLRDGVRVRVLGRFRATTAPYDFVPIQHPPEEVVRSRDVEGPWEDYEKEARVYAGAARERYNGRLRLEELAKALRDAGVPGELNVRTYAPRGVVITAKGVEYILRQITPVYEK